MLSTDRCGLIALGETNCRLRLGLSALVVDRLAAARSAHRDGLEHPDEPLCPRITIGCSTARTVLRWSREGAAESAGGSSGNSLPGDSRWSPIHERKTTRPGSVAAKPRL